MATRLVRILFLLTFSLVSFGIRAESPKVVAKKTVPSADLAERLKYYRSIETLDVHFQQVKKLVDAGVEIRSEGNLHLKPQGKVIWEITKPSSLKITLDSEGVELRSMGADGKTPSIQRYSLSQMPKEGEASSFRSMSAWLTLDAEKLSAAYEIEDEGASTYLFTPRQAEGPFSSLKMTLGKSGHLEKLLLKERSGDEMQLTFGTPKVKRRGK